MAAIWKGSLTFGLVNIPVELKTAVVSRLRASLEEGSGKKGTVRAKRKAVAASRKPAKKKRQTA